MCSSDLTAELVRIQVAMRRAGVDATHLEIKTQNGHDAFLVDYPLITPPIREFLTSLSSSDS